MKTYKTLIGIAAMSAAVMPVAMAQEPVTMERTVLFDHGDMGSKFWRIPALATTNDSIIIAVADKRNDRGGDLPNQIDLAMRRSPDFGKNWTIPKIIVKADSVGGYGDAALGVHRPTGDLVIVAAHGNGVWEATPDEPQHLVMLRSSDSGLTWSLPVDITQQIYGPKGTGAPIVANAGFASSGTMLCDDAGRLMFVLVANETDEMWGPLTCHLCYSDDGGYTWAVTDVIDDYGDEAKVTQLGDGSYYMSIRNRRKGGRRVSRSTDQGLHWTEPRATAQLIDPACNGDLITITPQQLNALGLSDIVGENAKNGLMLHSLANDPAERKNVSVLASDDLGVNWRKIYTVTPDGSSYSALALLPDGNLGIFSEENHPEGGFRLYFTKVNLTDLIKDAYAQ